MPRKIQDEWFLKAVAIIRERFPDLQTELTTNHPDVHGLLDIPAQPGLGFPVSMTLQNCDELHLTASNFWCEWFPCQEPHVFENFISAVSGLLSGEYRILEYWRGGTPIKAHLQRPLGDDWQRVASWSTLAGPISLRRETKIIQNIPPA